MPERSEGPGADKNVARMPERSEGPGANRSLADRGRIRGKPVSPLFPARGPVQVLLVGEAPGPRGADRSGIPFWGDRSGRLVYRALRQAGMADVPERAWIHWDGAELVKLGLRPRLKRAALTNAMPFCPTKDGRKFCAPARAELFDERNVDRLRSEIRRAARRCPHTLSVIALGRKAEGLLEALRDDENPFALHHLPHPSAQALATAGGRGASLAARERQWQERLLELLEHS